MIAAASSPAAAASIAGLEAFAPRNDAPLFPPSALALVVVLAVTLVGTLVWSWWAGRRRGGARLRWPLAAVGAPTASPAIDHAVRLDAQTRLYVVRWHGSELLLAAGAGITPVVLDRRPAPAEPAR